MHSYKKESKDRETDIELKSLFTKLQTTVNVVMLFLRIFYCVNFKK